MERLLSRIGARLWLLIELCVAVTVLVIESFLRLLVYLIARTNGGSKNEEDADYDRSTGELITSKGYPMEEHYVLTKDGYILTLHRIPHGKIEDTPSSHAHSNGSSNGYGNGHSRDEKEIPPKRPVVFIMHGFMQNSEVWVCRSKAQNNVAFVLADAGYDVWLGNTRGNKYSMKHIKIAPQEKKFWSFCLDELIQYDAPAMIDYVLSYTEVDKLSYIGFSQGTALGFGAFAYNPNLAKKINVFIALASTAKVLPLQNPFLNVIAHTRPEFLFFMFGEKSFLTSALWWRLMLSRGMFSRAIEYGNYVLFGWDGARVHPSEKEQVYAHLFSTTSVKCVVHWFQIICARRFQMFDDTYKTSARNVDSYYFNSVPSYQLSRIRCPVACFYGLRDNLSDIDRLVSELPKHTIVFEEPDYEHLDFLWADNAREHVFPHILALLKEYNDVN